MGFPKGLSNEILELVMSDPADFCIEANRRVKEKIKNHKENKEEIQERIENPKINLSAIPSNLKALFAFSKFIRNSDGKRMVADVLMESYLTDELKI